MIFCVAVSVAASGNTPTPTPRPPASHHPPNNPMHDPDPQLTQRAPPSVDPVGVCRLGVEPHMFICVLVRFWTRFRGGTGLVAGLALGERGSGEGSFQYLEMKVEVVSGSESESGAPKASTTLCSTP
jgi:hypothetical protein